MRLSEQEERRQARWLQLVRDVRMPDCRGDAVVDLKVQGGLRIAGRRYLLFNICDAQASDEPIDEMKFWIAFRMARGRVNMQPRPCENKPQEHDTYLNRSSLTDRSACPIQGRTLARGR